MTIPGLRFSQSRYFLALFKKRARLCYARRTFVSYQRKNYYFFATETVFEKYYI